MLNVDDVKDLFDTLLTLELPHFEEEGDPLQGLRADEANNKLSEITNTLVRMCNQSTNHTAYYALDGMRFRLVLAPHPVRREQIRAHVNTVNARQYSGNCLQIIQTTLDEWNNKHSS